MIRVHTGAGAGCRTGLAAVALVSVCAAFADAPAHAQGADTVDEARAIDRMRGDLYTARAGEQVTVFLVTDEGILLGDPLNREAAAWLAGQLAERFPKQPLRFIVHSHHHFDRAEGGSLFPAAAERVAHQDYNREQSRARTRLPAWLAVHDRNRDARLDASELDATPFAGLLSTHDPDANGAVTAQELYGNVRDVLSTYRSRRTIRLGGRTVELVHPGPAHAADMTVLYFPLERVVFAVDPPPVMAPPMVLGRADANHVYQWLREVATLDFDLLIAGDGSSVTREAVLAARDYLQALRDTIASARLAGRSAEDLRSIPAPETVRRSPHASAYASHVDAVFETLRVLTVDLGGAAVVDHGFGSDGYCVSHDTCSQGGAVRALRGAATVRPARGLIVVGELTASAQSWSSRQRAFYDEEYVFRAVRASWLAGYEFRPSGPLAVTPLAGMSLTVGDTRGAYRATHTLLPVGGRHAIAVREQMTGFTLGGDVAVSLGPRLGIVVPVRLTRTLGLQGDTWPNRADVQVGLGVRVRVLRHVF